MTRDTRAACRTAQVLSLTSRAGEPVQRLARSGPVVVSTGREEVPMNDSDIDLHHDSDSDDRRPTRMIGAAAAVPALLLGGRS